MVDMRIVSVADTHGYQADLVVPDGDVFVHAGDLLRTGTLEQLEPVARWIRELPHAQKIVVAGNHDWCFARDPECAREMLGEDVHYLQDSAVAIDGILFWGSPWQPEFHGWAFNLPRGQALAEKWALIPKDVQVLITHAPPFGYGDEVEPEGNCGCKALLKAIERTAPGLHVFGHIHHGRGSWTYGASHLTNVTTAECQLAPTVVDLEDGAVRFVSDTQ